MLVRAGKLGYPIRFGYEAEIPRSLAVKDVLMHALARAGFRPEPVATTRARYTREILDNPRAPVDLRLADTCAEWPSGGQVVSAIFGPPSHAAGPGRDREAFSSKAVDARIRQINLLAENEQPSAWSALDKEIQLRHFPVVVTGYDGVALMRGSRVANLNEDPVYGAPDWKDLWIRQ